VEVEGDYSCLLQSFKGIVSRRMGKEVFSYRLSLS
jgi:hypothetical protein